MRYFLKTFNIFLFCVSLSKCLKFFTFRKREIEVNVQHDVIVLIRFNKKSTVIARKRKMSVKVGTKSANAVYTTIVLTAAKDEIHDLWSCLISHVRACFHSNRRGTFMRSVEKENYKLLIFSGKLLA